MLRRLRLASRVQLSSAHLLQGRRLTLQDLSDRDLMDIGLTRDEVDYFTPERVIDSLRNRAADPWSRGVM